MNKKAARQGECYKYAMGCSTGLVEKIKTDVYVVKDENLWTIHSVQEAFSLSH